MQQQHVSELWAHVLAHLQQHSNSHCIACREQTHSSAVHLSGRHASRGASALVTCAERAWRLSGGSAAAQRWHRTPASLPYREACEVAG
eukprot:363764-Chlamydomonas_euryale.AAC.18